MGSKAMGNSVRASTLEEWWGEQGRRSVLAFGPASTGCPMALRPVSLPAHPIDLGLEELPKQCPVFPRKEVIQPHLPVRLPCYDFVPITSPTLDGCLPYGLAHRLQVLPAFMT